MKVYLVERSKVGGVGRRGTRINPGSQSLSVGTTRIDYIANLIYLEIYIGELDRSADLSAVMINGRSLTLLLSLLEKPFEGDDLVNANIWRIEYSVPKLPFPENCWRCIEVPHQTEDGFKLCLEYWNQDPPGVVLI